MRFISTFITVLLTLQLCAQRIGNSPYPPITATPDTLYYVNIDGMTQSQRLTVVTLQGLLAQSKPRIMVGRGTRIFHKGLERNYGVTYDSTYYTDFAGLIAHFAPEVPGYVLCTLGDSSSNAAISACGGVGAIAVTPADTAVMSVNNIPMLLSALGRNESWALDSIGGSYSDRIIGFQDYGKYSYLSDYSVFSHAMHFTAPTASALTNRAFGRMQPNSALLGWGNENDLVLAASQHGLHVHAADFANNLSTFTNFNVTAQQHEHSADTNVIPGTHTVCFIMTDGDNIQWLLGDFADNALWYGSPHRGQVPIGWTVSPALAELAPTVLKNLYDTAKAGDYFIAGSSGMGYLYPDDFNPIDSAAAISDRMMHKADLSIVNVICNVWEPQSVAAYLAQPDIDGMFYYTFESGYTGLFGYSQCFYGKPMISARYTLWQSYVSAPILARLVTALPKDPTDPDSYTLVSVHVWDHSVDSVIAAVQLFDSTIRVVAPDAFIKLYKKGTGCRAAGLGVREQEGAQQYRLNNVPNPVTAQTEIRYTLPSANFISLKLYDATGKEVKVLYAGTQSEGEHHVTFNTADLAAGIYTYVLYGPGISASSQLIRN